MVGVKGGVKKLKILILTSAMIIFILYAQIIKPYRKIAEKPDDATASPQLSIENKGYFDR
jgi:hypothetical protein